MDHVTCTFQSVPIKVPRVFRYNSQDPSYLKRGNRNFQIYEAPSMKEPKSNNKNFEKSIIFQGATIWNTLPDTEGNITTSTKFKKKQKRKLNELFPYVN